MLLEVFTEPYGRLGLVARGARSAKSNLRGDLQPFRPLLLSWYQRGELGTLTGVEADGSVQPMRGISLYSAFYLNELLVRLLARQDPHSGLYTLYRSSLQQLAAGRETEPVLRIFEKHLLNEIGYGLLLDQEAEHGQAVQADQYYDYHLESGPVVVADSRGPGFLFKGSSLLALASEQLSCPEVLRDAKRLMRSALALYLGGKPLKSRELFHKLGN